MLHRIVRIAERHAVVLADADRILRGEWFRVVTALSLHADLSHALGNAIVGGLLLSALGRRIGTAAAAWITLLSGAAGNARAHGCKPL